MYSDPLNIRKKEIYKDVKNEDFGDSKDTLDKFLQLKLMIKKINLFFAEIMNKDCSSFYIFESLVTGKDPLQKSDSKSLINKLKNTMNFINWKHTPANNGKFFNSDQNLMIFSNKNRFKLRWLRDFNIGDLMYMKLIDLDFFKPVGPFEIISNPTFIVDLILYLA